MPASLLAFVGISVVVIVTPGPDTAITIRNTLLGGRAAGVATGLGVALGQTVWALATALGVVALLVASEPLFLTLKYAGAGYLVLLGAQALRSAWRAAPAAPGPTARPGRRLRPGRALVQGIVSDLGNPKMAVFFASLLPQFVPPGADPFACVLALGAAFAAMTFAWLAAYAVAVARAGDVLRRPAVRRTLEAVTGGILMALGVRIAAEAR